MDSFISLGLGADGMTAFVGLYLGESTPAASDVKGRHWVGLRLGLGV